MAKAVLIMDMPKSCDRCKFKLNVPCNRNYCYISHNSCDKECSKPDWCPLRKLPEHKRTIGTESECNKILMNAGWNACLEEIGEFDN